MTEKSRRKSATASKRKVAKSSKKITAKTKVARKKTVPQKVARKKAAGKAATAAKRSVSAVAIRKTAANEPSLVVMSARSDIKNVVKLKEQLTKARAEADKVVIDAAEVESIDTAALQLLTAFANTMRKNRQTLEWKQPSAALIEIASLLDVSQAVGLDDALVSQEDDGLCPVF